MPEVSKINRNNMWSYLLALIFGFLLPLSLAPFNYWPLGLLSAAGFFTLIFDGTSDRSSNRNSVIKRIFWLSLSYGIGIFSIGASWIFVSIHHYGHASIALSLLLITPFIVSLAFLFAIPFALFGKVLYRYQLLSSQPSPQHIAILLLIFPSLWVISEWFRGWAFSGFPWLYLGYGHTDTWLSGWAPITGVFGISWITAFSGALLGLLYHYGVRFLRTNIGNTHTLLGLGSGLLLTTCFWLGGSYLKHESWTVPTGKVLSIGLVQPALPLEIKWDPHQLAAIIAQYRTDSATLWKNDLVVWPESAIPRFYHQVTEYLDAIVAEANSTHTALIIGIPTAVTSNQNSSTNDNIPSNKSVSNDLFSTYYNSAIGLGEASGIYHKQHLVPFGEYVPFEQWLRGTITFFDLPMSAFNSGPEGQKPIKAKGVTIGTVICYEIAYSELVRESALNANMLLTLSNDTWFGKSIGPKQHFQIARMRAMENRKPLIRATNDGISALITASGRISATIPSYQRNTLEGTLEPRKGLTPFGRYGSYPVVFISFFCVLMSLLLIAVRPDTKKIKNSI